MAKQIQIQGLEGVKIAEGLQRALEKQGTPAKRIVLLNDSTAVLLAGAMLYGNQCSDILGFILGTGINAAYFESAKIFQKFLPHRLKKWRSIWRPAVTTGFRAAKRMLCLTVR